ELFRYLAEEEEKHLKTFQGFYDTLKEGLETTPYNWEEAKLYLEALVDSRFFTGPDQAIDLAKEAKDELEAINSAISFEKDTLLFFYEMLEVIKPQDRDLVKKIIGEEKKHVRRLSTMKGELPQP
ncbi:MAG: ferritin family protein, partial [bacterium]